MAFERFWSYCGADWFRSVLLGFFFLRMKKWVVVVFTS
jgi:hypothetical protein